MTTILGDDATHPATTHPSSGHPNNGYPDGGRPSGGRAAGVRPAGIRPSTPPATETNPRRDKTRPASRRPGPSAPAGLAVTAVPPSTVARSAASRGVGARSAVAGAAGPRPAPPTADELFPAPSVSPLSTRVEQRGQAVVLRLHGLLVSRSAAPARAGMVRALELGPREIIVDLSGVRGADPAGAVLLAAMNRHARRAGASLRFVGIGAEVWRALRERGIAAVLAPLTDDATAG